MKRKSLLLMTLLALFASGAWAQTATNRDDDYYGYVEIGDGTLGMVDAPLRGFYKSSYDQMIYTASQINKSGTITKIGFNAKETETYTLARKPKIYMGHTSKSSFDSDTDFVSINDLTLVYDYSASGNSTWNITAGWNAFVLDTPFDYNGEDNLVIAMHCEMIDAYESTSFYYTGTTFHQVVYACSDTDDPIPATYDNNWDSYGGLKGKTTELPNVRLYFDEPIIETCFDFESGSMPSGWASEGAGTWRVTRWADYFGSILPHGGQYNAVRYSEGNETYLVMPSQDFSNTSSATLNFWYVNRDYQDPWLGYQKSDILAVCYRIGSDGTWNTLWSTKDVHNSWAEQSINLTGLAADYQIGFKYTKRGGKGVGLDDICLVTQATPPSHITQIASVDDWNEFCDAVNDGHDYSGETVTMTADLTGITTMAGTESHPFRGTFDGQGHTLNVNIMSQEQGAAPFHYINGATIANLVVSGTVTGQGHHAAGLVGFAGTASQYYFPVPVYNTIRNCLVHTNVNGIENSYIGGIVGHNKSVHTTIEGCVYDGTLQSENYKGGFIGWSNYSVVSITDSYFCGAHSGNGSFNPVGCKTETQDGLHVTITLALSNFYHNYTGTICTDSHALTYNTTYANTLGNMRVYTITGESPITVAIANPTTYNVSGINAGTLGIVYNGMPLAGNGDQVDLTLGGSSTGYRAAPGTLTGGSNPYTLTMTASNTIISALTVKYHIANTESDDQMTWEQFASMVYSGTTFSGETVYLDEDITVSTVAGNGSHAFRGTFDGQSHTMTLAYGSPDTYSTTTCAPFYHINGATIKDLVVTGSIYSLAQYNAGLVSTISGGTSIIRNCLNSVSINCSNWDGSHGGFVSRINTTNGSRVQFYGCAFTGELIGPISSTWGGFIGHRYYRDVYENDKKCYADFTDCLFAATTVDINSPSYGNYNRTFCRSYDGLTDDTDGTTFTNCYHLVTVYADDGGKHAYSITAGENVTVANAGTATSYNVSGITSYGTGIEYNNVLYAGNGDQVSLTLEGSSTGYIADHGHGALPGSGNSYTLTMPANNTVIRPLTMKYHIANTESDNQMTWEQFASLVNAGITFSDETVYLDEDITVSTMVGDDSHAFSGTFDGQSHTMTLAFGTDSEYSSVMCAPFYDINGATIENLAVTGNIYSSAQFNAGLVSTISGGTNIIRNCLNSVSIHSNRNGDGTNGGFVAIIRTTNDSHVQFYGCAFTGELIGSSTTNWGGFIGWREYGSNNIYCNADFTDCLFAATTVDISTASGTNSRTFSRSRNNTTDGATYTNCYYLATVQANDGGKQAYGVTAVDHATLNMAGTAEVYNVSGITGYTPGLVFNNNIYGGEGDDLALILNGSATGIYDADYGTLTQVSDIYWTLTMDAHDTQISVSPCYPPINLSVSGATLTWDGEAESYNVRYKKLNTDEPVFSDGFETNLSKWTNYDADGDGFYWNFVVNTGTGSYPTHSGNGVAYSRSKSSESYGSVALHPDNWLITQKQVQLGGIVSLWANGLDAENPAEHFAIYVSTTGNDPADFTQISPEYITTSEYVQYSAYLSDYSGMGYVAIRHYNVSNQFILNVDDFVIYGSDEWVTINNVSGHSLDIPVLTHAANYVIQVQGVDCDGNGETTDWSEAATFTIPGACDVPTGLTAEVTGNTAELSWTGVQEDYNVQYGKVVIFEDFDNGIPSDWTTIDADNDGNDWSFHFTTLGVVSSASYLSGAITPDNWLISPLVDLKGTLSVWLQGQDRNDYAEHFAIYLSTNGNSVADFTTTLIGETVTGHDMVKYTADLSGYAGQQGYIAIRHFNCTDQFWLNVDDFSIIEMQTTSVEGSTITINNLEANTEYMWQVQGVDCDGEGSTTDWSASAIFTTPEFYVKDIVGYGTGTGNYYLIASPVGAVSPENVGNMLNNEYDLYAFEQAEELEWRNYKAEAFNLEPGQGYLYANSQDVTLVFPGTPYNGSGEVTLSKTDNINADFLGWNLVGNPFAAIAYIEDGRSFYTMNGDGDEIIAAEANSIAPMEGIFVIANTDGETMTFTTEAPANNGSAKLSLNLSHGPSTGSTTAVIDRAIVRFGEGRQLPKFQIRDNSTKIFIPQNGNDYAVVRGEAQGNLPVSFKAKEDGTYTLSLGSEDMAFSYLHLIDNMTGNDVDLLQMPSYSFEAKTTDYESRFKLVFATKDGPSTGSETFAFISNGNILVNGEGTLQVIDMTGRIIVSHGGRIQCVPTNGMPAGVYVLRLINGNDVKTQKIVIE